MPECDQTIDEIIPEVKLILRTKTPIKFKNQDLKL